ncbi:hypothetical protein BGX38DRAFT_1269462 [Terfezia claveryi]|nr:hypothetical protein BGX38DRAFT_1269462 [Terfezia claveryi]
MIEIVEAKHANLHPSQSWTKYDYDEEIRPAIHRIYSYFKKKDGWSFKLAERAFKLLWEDRVKNYRSQLKRKVKQKEQRAKQKARAHLAGLGLDISGPKNNHQSNPPRAYARKSPDFDESGEEVHDPTPRKKRKNTTLSSSNSHVEVPDSQPNSDRLIWVKDK